MFKKYSKILKTLLFFCDILFISLCWNIAYFLRFYKVNYPKAASIPDYTPYWQATGVVMILASFCFTVAKMYGPSRGIFDNKTEIQTILKSNAFLFFLLLAFSFFYRDFSFSRVHAVYFFVLGTCSIIFFRLIAQNILYKIRQHGKFSRSILIVGNQNTAHRFHETIREHPELGLIPKGIVSAQKQESKLELPHLGTYNDLPDIISTLCIEEVFIALDSEEQSDLKEINHYLATQTINLNVVPDIFHSLLINPEFHEFSGIPILTIRQNPILEWGKIIKRTMDIIGSIIGIIAFTPAWIIIPLLTKFSSPGPIFYTQERMGLDGISFKMFKFRSMRVDAEKETGAVWTTEDDERTTPFGSFIRSTSLDELPQFFNVLQGSMSLVGPRPERPVFIEGFQKKIPNYMLRHKMKAGITGWAQVNGWRGNTSLEKRIEYDLYYLTNWSVFLDIKIILMTFYKGFVNPNAY